MDSYFLEFDLECEKADYLYECAYDKFMIDVTEVHNKVKLGYFNESSNDASFMLEEAGKSFVDSIKAFFSKIFNGIKTLVKKVTGAVKTKFNQITASGKLKNVEQALVTNKELAGQKIKITDRAKYIAAYDDYVKAAVAGVRKLQTTQYKNADEYKKAQDELSEKLQGIIKSWNLDGSDVRQLNIGIADAVKLSNKEIKDFDKNMSEIQGKWTETLSILQKCALNEDDPTKIGFIKTVTNQFNNVSSKAYNYCAKHPAQVVAATLATAGGMATTKAYRHGDASQKRLVKENQIRATKGLPPLEVPSGTVIDKILDGATRRSVGVISNSHHDDIDAAFAGI